MTAVLETAQEDSVTAEVEESSLASWLSRAGAFAIDVLFGLGVTAAVFLTCLTADGWLRWLSAIVAGLIIFAIAVNRMLLPAVTGWSLGRALFGIRVMRRDGEPVGPWWLLLRDVTHLLDTAALFIGWVWPLWDRRNRTFADLLVRTEVRTVDNERPDVRRAVFALLAAGVVIAAAGAGLTYLTVYRHQQAVDTAREEISDQGPKMVEKILSYNAGTMKDNFAEAQGLVTDGYRDQLLAQQHRIEKKPAVVNEYLAVTSAVLPGTTPDHATMLVFLLGQYQAQREEVRISTATTRVAFEKSSDGKWRVSNVDVFPKTLMGTMSP